MANKKEPGKAKALFLAKTALEKKAIRPVILDVRSQTNLCDYFLIVSGDSTVQVRALFNHLITVSKKERLALTHREDDAADRWLLLDFEDVIVHIFLEEERAFYDLEYLWRKAKKVSCASLHQRSSSIRKPTRKR